MSSLSLGHVGRLTDPGVARIEVSPGEEEVPDRQETVRGAAYEVIGSLPMCKGPCEDLKFWLLKNEASS